MKPFLPALFLSLDLSTAAVTPAAAYPVDCAILLCLAGGWPASAECAHARAVFIRRITPWPIEPPLQIWNCPMRASFPGKDRPLNRLFDIAFRDELAAPAMSLPEQAVELMLVDAQADVDISDPAFDFVRSIRVFEITYQQRRSSDGDCNSWGTIYMGSYGAQGDYTRRRSSTSAVPEASDFTIPTSCSSYWHRSVFVEWRDYEGSYGHEEVHY
ncbi:hypothetical protein [Cypionkella psychrotolerans]|uniref:hypothetical protein n=1 Tax=Cypionkella psychrotolerans TaxID=1678131 RepID=UPI000A5EEDFB|nr:hypothetical protein [Cypionkella psychrotolerans]